MGRQARDRGARTRWRGRVRVGPIRRLAGCALIAPLFACGSALPSPTAADARRTGRALSELQAGRRLYVRKCSGCHALIPPGRRSPAAWTAKIGEMTERAGLDAKSRAGLEAYLRAFARRPP